MTFRHGALSAVLVTLFACSGGTSTTPDAGSSKPTDATPKAASDSTARVVKIVSSLPRTGSANVQSTTIVNGIRMAIEEVGGKVPGRDVAIQYEDWDDASATKGAWDPEVETANADKAAKDPTILAYIGPYNSGAAKISMPILNRAGLAMISPANTAVGLTKPGLGEANEPAVYQPTGKINYFRVVPADDIQGRVGAEWMKSMGAKSVWVLDDREMYGKGLADVFEATAKQIGLRVLGRDGIDPKAQEYRSLMTRIKGKNPDWIYFGGTTQTNAGQLAKDMVAVGLKAKFMVPDGCFEKALIDATGADNANGRVFATFGGVPPDRLTGEGAKFVERYRAKFGSMPEAYAVYGYVAAQAAIQAMAKAATLDRAGVVEALKKEGQVDGALGTWRFDAFGDTSLTTMSGNVVKGGEWTFVTLLGVDGGAAPTGDGGANGSGKEGTAPTDAPAPTPPKGGATPKGTAPTPPGHGGGAGKGGGK